MIQAIEDDRVIRPVSLFDNESTDSTLSIEQLLTIAEVAMMLKVSAPSVRRLQQKRRVRYYKVGGSVRFTEKDILAFLEESKVEVVG